MLGLWRSGRWRREPEPVKRSGTANATRQFGVRSNDASPVTDRPGKVELKRVLIVDDEQDLLDILSDNFEGRYKVETATSGAAAIECFTLRRPDLVLLDIYLPEMSGVEVLKTFQHLDPTVPVIMVTGNVESGAVEECLSNGAMGWVPKPFNMLYIDHLAAVALAQSRQG